MSLQRMDMDSAIGVLTLIADGEGLRRIDFAPPRPLAADEDYADGPVLRETRAQLQAYFAGRLQNFDLPLAPQGTTFQCAVWAMLATIPYGETWSYRQVAERIGKPQAVRAVGAANGRNPIPIVLPCHRVIGSDGSLTGFGGGLPTKAFLLRLEGALPNPELFAAPDLFAASAAR